VKIEDRSTPDLARYGNFPVVQFDNGFPDGQPHFGAEKPPPPGSNGPIGFWSAGRWLDVINSDV
jgi:hypothetical protein